MTQEQIIEVNRDVMMWLHQHYIMLDYQLSNTFLVGYGDSPATVMKKIKGLGVYVEPKEENLFKIFFTEYTRIFNDKLKQQRR